MKTLENRRKDWTNLPAEKANRGVVRHQSLLDAARWNHRLSAFRKRQCVLGQ
jgi:hypothetical protein